jgi:cobalt ECF transporter T component CbiQ
MRRGLLEATTLGFARAITRAMLSEHTAQQRGLLQALDPRVRVIGLLVLVVAVTLVHKIAIVLTLFVAAALLAVVSNVSLLMLVRRVWLVVLAFTGVIALPALFVTPGDVIATSGQFVITQQGLRAAGLLVLRVETAVTLTTLLVVCTPWAHVLKALRALGLPKEAITMLAMTYRYVFLLVETATQMFDSRRSRTVGVLAPQEQRRMLARTAGVLLSKSVETGNEVYLAMRSRGFSGEVQVMSEFQLTAGDYAALLMFLAAGVVAVWAGR